MEIAEVLANSYGRAAVLDSILAVSAGLGAFAWAFRRPLDLADLMAGGTSSRLDLVARWLEPLHLGDVTWRAFPSQLASEVLLSELVGQPDVQKR